jgi:2-polyprenyl-6-methoxyphenol hydroxylase-like FAD-dependent oxidoreductase
MALQNFTDRTDRTDEVPVLIAGGGPAGLLCAYLLSKYNSESIIDPFPCPELRLTFLVKSLVIEKYPRRLAAPKAHAICPRSFEIFRQFGLDTTALRKLGSPREDAFWVNFVTNLSGERIGVLPYERMDVGVLDDTPEASIALDVSLRVLIRWLTPRKMIHNVPQPDLESFLAQELQGDSNTEIRKNVAFVSCSQVRDQSESEQ